MGIFDKMKDAVSGKTRKEAAQLLAQKEMEVNYATVCKQIVACEAEMNRCINASMGLPQDSYEYRMNLNTYNSRKNELTLLRAQEKQMSEGLSAADRARLLRIYAEQNAELGKLIDKAVGTDETMGKVVAAAELGKEKLERKLESVNEIGAGIFEDAAEKAGKPAADTEFDAMVAAANRRKDTLTMAGISTETQPAGMNAQAEDDEFARMVADAKNKE